MNAHTSVAITNICIVALVFTVVYYTHNAWALLGLIFLKDPMKINDKKDSEKDKKNEMI